VADLTRSGSEVAPIRTGETSPHGPSWMAGERVPVQASALDVAGQPRMGERAMVPR